MKFCYLAKKSARYVAENRLFCLRFATMGITAAGAAAPDTAFVASYGSADT